jgi:hypothetical protein
MAEWSEQLWPSIKEGQNPELSVIHLFIASTWSSTHLRQHIKSPVAMVDRPATLPGVDRSLYSLTARSTSQGIAALSIRSASSHHSNGWPQRTTRYPILVTPTNDAVLHMPFTVRRQLEIFLNRWLASWCVLSQHSAKVAVCFLGLWQDSDWCRLFFELGGTHCWIYGTLYLHNTVHVSLESSLQGH